MKFSVLVPGVPVAQGRPIAGRAFGTGFTTLRDPVKSRTWKGVATSLYMDAIERQGLKRPLFTTMVEARVTAMFPCPKSKHRKREPAQRARYAGRLDSDNIGKAALDAGISVIFEDDNLVVRLVVEKWHAAQDEAPYVLVEVEDIE